MARLSTKELFRKLEGREFADYVELHDAVLQLFNEHVSDFPPGYSYLQFLQWGKEKNWIHPANSRGFYIKVDAQ
jgi:hypothetical protein